MVENYNTFADPNATQEELDAYMDNTFAVSMIVDGLGNIGNSVTITTTPQVSLAGGGTVGVSVAVTFNTSAAAVGAAEMSIGMSGGSGNTEGNSKTDHGEQRAKERGFSNDKISDIQQNYSQKVYQPGGRTVYAKKNGNYYDVVITNRNGEIITTVGGNTRTLKTWNDVTKMLNNQGGYTSIPLDLK
ncbi:MAG: hypothetical protein A2Y18_07820 [Clostridiales bacterium GWD2_32_19]|nr:MAG: hypothetical protein A2Y18_07820 [Clostridiales bacterium GWD2_32_19]